jgi:hypothetical protein
VASRGSIGIVLVLVPGPSLAWLQDCVSRYTLDYEPLVARHGSPCERFMIGTGNACHRRQLPAVTALSLGGAVQCDIHRSRRRGDLPSSGSFAVCNVWRCLHWRIGRMRGILICALLLPPCMIRHILSWQFWITSPQVQEAHRAGQLCWLVHTSCYNHGKLAARRAFKHVTHA